MNDFAAFILTHGRPNRVVTYKSLRKAGYTGDIYIIIDDEDSTAPDYVAKYGRQVIMFSKEHIASTFDEADNFKDRRSIVYARNASFEIAEQLGIKYFIQLDDDYTAFSYVFDGNLEYREVTIRNLDAIFHSMLSFYKSIPAASIAMSQGGDFIGGKKSTKAAKLSLWRKAMNTFICSTDRPFKFLGRINEDVNTYTCEASRGMLFLSFPNVKITQRTTQSSKGGMTGIYEASGTYVKSFYSVMMSPSSVKVKLMGDKHKRLHHSVKWDNTVPSLLNEKWRKQ